MADGNGNGNANGGGTATAEAPATGAARAEEVMARSLEQTRRWINQRRLSAEAMGPGPRLSTREWLVRVSFGLFAAVTMAVVVFSALGLLNATEAISAMLPVSTLSAMIIGFYLGGERPG